MRNIIHIAIWKTRWIMKDKSNWVNMFILPIVFSLIFGGLSSNETNNADYMAKVGVVPTNTTVREELLTDIIGEQLEADIVSFASREEAIDAMKNNEVSSLVLWQDHFEESWAKKDKTPWEFVYEKQTAQNFMMEQQMNQLIIGLNAVTMTGVNEELSAKEQVEEWLGFWKNYRESTIGVKVQYGKQEENNGFSRMFVGFSLMFLMFALNNSAATILEEKEVGTWNRMLLAPLNKTQLILGNILHFLTIGLIQFSVLMAFSRIVFDVNWGYYVDTLLFAMLVVLTVSGLGFMLATFVKTKVQQAIIGSLIITVTSMLGGVYWPLDFVTGFMRNLANFIPQKWAMDGLLQLMSGGYRLTDITTPITMLLIFLVIFYTVGLLRVRKI